MSWVSCQSKMHFFFQRRVLAWIAAIEAGLLVAQVRLLKPPRVICVNRIPDETANSDVVNTCSKIAGVYFLPVSDE